MSIKHRTDMKAGAAAMALAFIMVMAGCASASAPAGQSRESTVERQMREEQMRKELLSQGFTAEEVEDKMQEEWLARVAAGLEPASEEEVQAAIMQLRERAAREQGAAAEQAQ